MRWEELEKQYDIDIEPDEPVFPINVVCHIVGLQYWTLHEIVKEGIIAEPKKAKKKKLFSCKDMKRLKYIRYLIEDQGVNVKGVKIILAMEDSKDKGENKSRE